MSAIRVEPGPPHYVSFPLKQMATTLAERDSLENFVEPFTNLPLEEQLALFSLRNDDRANIEALAAELKPGTLALRAHSITHHRDCGSSSGESTTVYSDSFIVGERGLYFGAMTGREAGLSMAPESGKFRVTSAPGPRILRVMPIIDLEGHYSVHEQGVLFGRSNRELRLGDLTLGSHVHYLEQEQPGPRYDPSNTRLVFNVKEDSESFKMLKEHLKQNAA